MPPLVTREVTLDDPEYYAEILTKTSSEAVRRKPIPTEFCPSIPGIDSVDDPLAQRLQRILDSIASISLFQRGHWNVAAVTASLKDNGGVLDTTLYLAFNREPDPTAAERCLRHLNSIFEALRNVPYKSGAIDNSPKIIEDEFEHDLFNIYKIVHTYSFDIFKYRVLKRAGTFEKIRAHVEQDQTHFGPGQRDTLLTFLRHVEGIIRIVQGAHDMPHSAIPVLSKISIFWKRRQLLREDENKLTLLDNVDQWLVDEHNIHISLRRWAVKIMSFVISVDRLFLLTQSRRLRKILEGKFTIEILDSPAVAPYKCDLSGHSVAAAVNNALDETVGRFADSDEERRSFIKWLKKKPDVSWAERTEPTVHAELAIIMAIDKGETDDVLPYIGVSKLSCVMCSHYIEVYNQVTDQMITTKGSHGKAYFGWSWPVLPHHDKKLRPAFLQSIKQQVRRDFRQYRGGHHRKSDSSVDTDSPGLKENPSASEIDGLLDGLNLSPGHF